MKDLNCWQSKFESCCYSGRLIAKLLAINKVKLPKQQIDILEVKKAIYYAKKYHSDQKRQSGEPYYTHPLQVAYMVANYCFKTDIVVISILHDTLEDTELTKGMIIDIFGSTVADGVEALSRVKLDNNNVEYEISIAEMLDLLWLKRKNDELLFIKYFDRVHNMQTINAKSADKALRITKETLEQFVSLGMYIKSKVPHSFNADQVIIDLCFQQLDIKPAHSSVLMECCEDSIHLPLLTFQNV